MIRSPLRVSLLPVFASAALLAGVVSGQMSVSTDFNHNARRAGTMFDVVATNGVLITDFDVNLIPAVPALDVEVYAVTGGGSFVGNEQSPAAWTRIGRATHVRSLNVSQAAPGVPTPLGLALSYPIPAGTTQGFYITIAGDNTPLANSFAVQARFDLGFLDPAGSDANLTILKGISNELNGTQPFGNPVPAGAVPGGGCSVFSGTVHYALPSGQPGDLMLANVLSPTGSGLEDCDLLGAAETVTVRVVNAGSTTLAAGTTLTTSYSVDGSAPVGDAFQLAAPLPPLTPVDRAISAPVDLSARGSYGITASVSVAGDPNPANDALAVTVHSGGVSPVTSFPYVENFDGSASRNTQVPPPGWLQERDDANGAVGGGTDWFFSNQNEAATVPGPFADHTTGVAGQGYFAYVNDFGSFLDIGLRTPCLDISSLTNPILRFFYFSENPMTPSLENELHVDVISHPSGTVTADVIPPLVHNGSMWDCVTVDLSAFGGTIQIRFRGNTGLGNDFHDQAIDDVMVGEDLAVDVTLRSIDAPSSNTQSCDVLGMAPVTVTVCNAGTGPVAAGSTLQMSYSIDGGTPVTEPLVLAATLDPCDCVSFTFATPADLTQVGSFTFDAAVSLAGDLDPGNDAAPPVTVQTAISPLSLPFSEDFDGVPVVDVIPPPGWMQDPNDGGGTGTLTDWIFRDTPTPSSNTGPPADHTTGSGVFAYLEDSSNEHPAINLLTPCIDLAGGSPLLSYFVYSKNGQSNPSTSENFLHLDVITFPGAVESLDVVPPIGHLGDGWMQQFVDLAAFAGQTVQVRFRGTTDGGSFRHDIAIDDVMIEDAGNLGTMDDFTLSTLVNQAGDGTALTKTAAAGDAFSIGIDSPGATFYGVPPVIVGELYNDGSPPPSDFFLPSLHITNAAFVFYNGFDPGPLGPGVLGPGGVTLGFFVPPMLDHRSLRIQGVLGSPLANNGIYATTNAHDVDLTD